MTQIRRIYLFIFACDQECRDANQLESSTQNIVARAKLIDEMYTKVKSSGHKFEFEVHFDEPINQNGTHPWSDVRLSVHVHGWRFYLL